QIDSDKVGRELRARLALWERRLSLAGVDHKALFSKAMQVTTDVFEIADANAVLAYVNPAYERVLGYSAEDVLGKTPAQVVRSSFHPPEYFANITTTLRAGREWKGLLVSQAKDGRLVHFETTVIPIADRSDRVTHHLAIKRDITSRLASEARLKTANEELEQARDAALAANQVKSQFLANMSHELRTPLNAIIGYSEMLLEEAEEMEGVDVFSEDLDKIQEAGKHLLNLINDILDLSKIEAGKMDLYFEDVSLRETIDAVVSTLTPLARERNNLLSVDYRSNIDIVEADGTRLKQVLFNLVSNANKFTKEGTIEVRVIPDDARDGWHTIEIIDSGIGMTQEQIARLFRPFVQADASTTRKYGGTGLGLTISQRFCEMMGGTIHVRSEPGLGSTFAVTLPLAPGTAVPSESQPRSGTGRRVLVIDDDPTMHALITRTLKPAGFEVDIARGGEVGLARARESLPDLIVLDIVMPGLDGWSVLTALKEDSTTHDIPVVMLSFLESRNAGLALGAADYLVKPVPTTRLVNVVKKHCGALPSKVLVVDDDEGSRELMRRALRVGGHRVVEAEDGALGLAALREERPDLILLDLMMPNLDGFTFLERIRGEEDHKDIPVIVVTAKELSASERRHLEGAAQQVIQKGGVGSQDLMRAVLRHVSQVMRQPLH
ncbi:MAG: response regulator, partial [Myxococcota bacterium]